MPACSEDCQEDLAENFEAAKERYAKDPEEVEVKRARLKTQRYLETSPRWDLQLIEIERLTAESEVSIVSL